MAYQRSRIMIRYAATLLVSFVLLGTIGATPAPKLTEADKDLANLQGTWASVSVDSIDGPQEYPTAVLIFDNGKFTLKNGKTIWFSGMFTIDPSKDPKTIDMTITDATDELFFKGKVQLCLYELKDDTLKWCFFNPHFERPAKFPPHGRPEAFAPKELGHWVFTFKKGKP
jgi:uncharacterized protein (TIGR03067 family)